jgi:hypothetical protein
MKKLSINSAEYLLVFVWVAVRNWILFMFIFLEQKYLIVFFAYEKRGALGR